MAWIEGCWKSTLTILKCSCGSTAARNQAILLWRVLVIWKSPKSELISKQLTLPIWPVKGCEVLCFHRISVFPLIDWVPSCIYFFILWRFWKRFNIRIIELGNKFKYHLFFYWLSTACKVPALELIFFFPHSDLNHTQRVSNTYSYSVKNEKPHPSWGEIVAAQASALRVPCINCITRAHPRRQHEAAFSVNRPLACVSL